MAEPIPPIPPGIVPLGADAGLPDAHHQQAGTMGCLFQGIIALVLGGGVLFLLLAADAFTSKYGSRDVGLVFSLMFGVPSFLLGGWLWYWHKNQTSMEVWTTPAGIAWRSALKKGFARWDDVAKHYRRVEEVYYQGRHTRTNIWITIETIAGKRVEFREFVQYILDLANRLDVEIAKRQLPAALTRVRSGETVQFDQLGLSMAGISWKSDRLPWGDVESIESSFGYLTIRKKGKWLSWKSVAVGDIPNLPIFKALLQELRPTP